MANGQTLPTSVTIPTGTTNTTIHLVHAHVNAVQYEHRTLTVHYVDANTGQPMSYVTGLADAQIEVFYQRDVVEDAVTGNVISVTRNWYWNNSGGDGHGYHIISGNWGHKTGNGGVAGNQGQFSSDPTTGPDGTTYSDGLSHNDSTILAVQVPNIPGYSAVTHGDWEHTTGAPGTEGVSNDNIGADEFTWPGWAASDAGDGTYTDYARYYEARPNHTIYFVKDQNAVQRTTVHYTKWENGSAAGSAASDATIDVYYENPVNPSSAGNAYGTPGSAAVFETHGSSNPQVWTIHYGNNWRWSTAQGDNNTAGYHVINGSWNNVNGTADHPSIGGDYYANLPVVNGYTPVYQKVDGSYTNQFAHNTRTFTQNSDGTWSAPDQQSTIYVVPNADLSKTVTRRITITNPDGSTSTQNQTVTFNRIGRVTNDDSSVVFGTMHNNGGSFTTGNNLWNSATSNGTTSYNQSGDETGNPTGTWAGVNVSRPGYTALIQIDGGTATASNSIAENNSVSANTADSNVTVTYVRNAANITIGGSGSKTFNGQAASVVIGEASGDVTHNVTADARITLPSGTNSVSLDSNDFSWEQVNADGTITSLTGAPTNVGQYRLVLNNSGRQKFQNLSSDFTWNYDPATSYYSYEIKAVDVTITQSGSGSKTYDGNAARVNATTLTHGTNMSFSNSVAGYPFTTTTLNSSDFTWYQINADGSETELSGAPTNAGHYVIRLNAAGLNALHAANPEYDFSSVSGGYSYTINQATATVALNDRTNTQTVNWNGEVISIDPSHFVPSITTNNSNQPTIAIPSSVHLDPSDYTITPANPTEPASYQVTLTPAGLQKIESAISGNSNYAWATTGNGILHVNRVATTIHLSGNGSTPYTGAVVTIPVGQYTITLSNGQTYTLQPGDLEFVSTGNTNVGTYTVRLSAQGLANIERLEGNHYDYSYDNSTAQLTVTPAEATATLHGHGSQVYNGRPATLSDTYTVTLSNGMTYTLQTGDYAFADTSGTIISAPTNAGHYRVVLTDQGRNAIEALTKVGSVQNYNWTFGSDATFDITAEAVTIKFSGSAWKVWDGSNASLYDTSSNDHSDMSGIHVYWNNSTTAPGGITFNLAPSDFEVVDENGNAVSAANYHRNGTSVEPVPGRGNYYIILTPAALARIQAANPNYTFSTASTTDPTSSEATYKIYARKAALTLDQTQTVIYGDSTALDPAAFRIHFTNWNPSDEHGNPVPTAVTPVAGDLNIIIPTGQPTTTDGVPINVGRYVVNIAPGSPTLAYLRTQYPDYDFDVINGNTGQDSQHSTAYYIVNPRVIHITIHGSQTISYGTTPTIDPTQYTLDFTNPDGTSSVASRDSGILSNGIHLPAAEDFEFVRTPGDVGTYQIRLSAAGIAYLQSLGNSTSTGDHQFATNYDWSQITNPETTPTADFTVKQTSVTATISGSQTITYGTTPTIDPTNYHLTITTADGTSLSGYTLQDGDLEFVDGTPTHAGTYTVQLSDQGLRNIENQFGTTNYTFSKAGTGTYVINKANATVSLTGNQTKTFDNTPASLDINDYTLTIHADNGDVLTYRLQSGDLQFVDDSGNPLTSAPASVGTYHVALTPAAISRIEALDGNSGNNFNWTWPSVGSTTDPTATYQITAATGTATLSGDVSKTYDGTPVAIDSGSDPVTVTVTYPGATSTTYTLRPGDYEFVGPDGTVYDSAHAPVNVGTYTIRLTTQGRNEIASLGNGNVDWTNGITGTATYRINRRDITVNVPAATQHVTYDGTAKGSSIDWNQLLPTINAGGITTPTITVTHLDPSDYTIRNDRNEVVALDHLIPGGTYHIYLNDNGMNYLKSLSGASNFNWPAEADGFGTFVIDEAAATAELNGSNHKTYDATSVTTDQLNSNGSTIKVTITVPGHDPITYTLQDGDYDWYNGSTRMTTAPVNAGTYTIRLNNQGIANLQQVINDAIGSGSVTIDAGHLTQDASFTIDPLAITVTINGSANVPSGTTTIPSDRYALDYNVPGGHLPSGLNLPSGNLPASDLHFVGPAPTSTTYNANFTVGYNGGQTAVQRLLGGNYVVTYADPTSPNYHVGAVQQTVEYVYVHDGRTDVIKTLPPFEGYQGQTVSFDPTAPGYELPNGWIFYVPTPAHITIEGGTTQIRIMHGSVVLPDETMTIKRTIIAHLPDGTTRDLSQTITLSRSVTADAVTGDRTYGPWSTGRFAAVDAPSVPGYTPSISEIPADNNVGIGYVDPHIVITYNSQPTNPSNPTNPTNPTSPTNPTGPTSPTKPTSPTNPTGPTSPTSPTSPTNPTSPTSPTEPTSPTSPVQPTSPAQPTTPGQNNNAGWHGKGENQAGFINGKPGNASINAARQAQNGKLPQTGNQLNGLGILGLLGISFTALLGFDPRKKRE